MNERRAQNIWVAAASLKRDRIRSVDGLLRHRSSAASMPRRVFALFVGGQAGGINCASIDGADEEASETQS